MSSSLDSRQRVICVEAESNDANSARPDSRVWGLLHTTLHRHHLGQYFGKLASCFKSEGGGNANQSRMTQDQQDTFTMAATRQPAVSAALDRPENIAGWQPRRTLRPTPSDLETGTIGTTVGSISSRGYETAPARCPFMKERLPSYPEDKTASSFTTAETLKEKDHRP